MNGIFCISLDFEKYWGIHDVMDFDLYKEQLRKVDEIVDQLSTTFEHHEIRTTWAVVGLLLEEKQEDLECVEIPYENKDYSPFPLKKEILKRIPLTCRSAIAQLEILRQLPNQEIASHTYSHFYALENGVTTADFELDCQRMKKAGDALNIDFKSIVFPRNQIHPTFLKIAKNYGIESFRGNQESRLWTNSKFTDEKLLKRGQRFLDAYVKIATTESFTIQDLPSTEEVLNIPSNRFFKPIGKIKALERKKLKQIKAEMSYAAKQNSIYHLWWHPHNFGNHTKEHFEQLNEILNHFNLLKSEYGFQSLNMKGIKAVKNG